MGAVTAAVIGAGTAIYSAKKSSDQAKQQAKLGREAIDAADPFRQYRPQYAEKLNKLMEDPSSITSTPEYKARMQAVQRQLSAQGYTGSGNALVAAAEEAGNVYQQAFTNLSQLSGAGVAPGGGYDTAAQMTSEGNAQKLSAIAGVGNNLTNLALTIGNKGGFNQPSSGNPNKKG